MIRTDSKELIRSQRLHRLFESCLQLGNDDREEGKLLVTLTIAVGIREEEGTEDFSRGCRGGESERRDRFDGLSASRPIHTRAWFIEESRAEIARVEKSV